MKNKLLLAALAFYVLAGLALSVVIGLAGGFWYGLWIFLMIEGPVIGALLPRIPDRWIYAKPKDESKQRKKP